MTRSSLPLDHILSQASNLADPFQSLLIRAEQLASSFRLGGHGRRKSGIGEEFWQFKPYQNGDSPNRIDWKQSAKGDHIFVRENEWHIAQSTYFWIDHTPSMFFQSTPKHPEKIDYARLIAAALAKLLLEAGEQIHLLNSPQKVNNNWPVFVENSLQQPSDEAFETTDLIQTVKPNSSLIILSDFLSETAKIEHFLRNIGPKVEQVCLIQVMDPLEETFPFEGRVLFKGSEGEAPFLASNSQEIKQAYLEKMARHRTTLESYCQHHNWFFSVAHTDKSALQVLTLLYFALSHSQQG